VYWIGRNLSWVVCKVFGRLEVVGRENVPAVGGALICANHVSYIDPPAVGAANKRQVHFMAKIELFEAPILGFCIARTGSFPVRRGTADRGALKKAVELLQGGNLVGIFPEGTRSLDGTLQRPEPGAAMIALRAGVPVIPAALINTAKLLRPHTALPRFARVKAVFGKPVHLDDLRDQRGREAVEEAGRRIMAAIADLLEEHQKA